MLMFKIAIALAFVLGLQTRTCFAQDVANVDSMFPVIIFSQQFEPTNELRQWYKEMEKCAKLTGEFDRIMWTVTNKPWKKNGGTTYGHWIARQNDTNTVILLNKEDWHIKSYVQHEMLHDILWRNGWQEIPEYDTSVPDSINIRRRHPLPWFEKCAPTYMHEMRQWEAKRQWLANPNKATYQLP